jgi:DNA polymerase elongation subunit (family B)
MEQITVQQVTLQQTVAVCPYDVTTSDAVLNEETGENHVNIHLWCLDKESKPWLVRVRDFPAYFYIELPPIVNGAPFEWDVTQAGRIVEYLKKAMGDNAPTDWSFGKFQKLYYYMADRKFPMIFVNFKTLEAVKHCNNLLGKPRTIYPFGTVQLKCYEANIDLIRKFYTSRDASFCQWLQVTGTEFTLDDDARITTEGTAEKPVREISVSYKNVSSIPSKVSESWFTHPRILAFDIETYSDNHKAMPNSLNSKHVSNIISCIYYELGNIESRKRYVIVLGDSNEVGNGVVVIRVQTEIELIKAFAKLITDLDPEIISGYNIFAYDYPYLDNRLKTKLQDWPNMGRIAKKPTEMTNMVWKSGAYGTNVINILQMDGRLSIDMLPIVKRDYRLDKYSLEFVSQNFLGRGKLDVKAVDMFRAYERQDFIIRQAKNFIMSYCGENVKNWEILDKLSSLSETANDEDKQKIDKIRARYIHALEEVTKIVAYCVQDSDLVVDLFDKLNVWIGLNALSSVVGVTIIQLFTRGQQVRCLSQVWDKASRRGVVLDKRMKDKVFYAGGFVFEPKPGLYDGVICLDFASLYPSIMRAMNICFTTLVPPDWYEHTPDGICNIIDVEQEEPVDGKIPTTGGGDNEFFEADDGSDSEEEGKSSSKVFKTYHYKWVKKDVRYGILPEIQDHLVGSRNVIKKEIAALEDELDECDDPKRLAEIKLLLVLKDKYSNALKVSANSLYGFLGAQEGGVLSLIEAAMCITATGRKLIMQVNKYVEEKYEADIVYGDSVTGDTPLFIKNGEYNPGTVRVDEMFESMGNVQTHHGDKELIDVSGMDLKVWTENGFTKIKSLIRHKLDPKKKMFRVLTHTGVVDVTEDHSLVLKNGDEISPKDVRIGTELMHNHNQHTTLADNQTEISGDEAWVMGLFLADGSCDIYQYENSRKASWAINKADLDLLNEAKRRCPFETKILDTIESSGVYKLVPSGESFITICEKYRPLFYNEHREKKVPDCILNAPLSIVEQFWNGFYSGDGDKDENGYCRFDQKGKQVCTGLYLLARRLGYNVSINDRESKPSVFRLTMTKKVQRKNPDAIKVLRELPHPGDIYVYDLETENHHFAVGPGALVVHNTDSSMINMHIDDPKECFAAGVRLAEEISGTPEKKLSDGTIVPAKPGLFPPPLKMEFEKAMRMLCIKKKKYAAFLIGKDGEYVREKNKDGSLGDYKILKRGIIVARRDTCKLVHKTYNTLLKDVLLGKPIKVGFDILYDMIDNLINDRIPVRGNLSIIRSLGASYKSDSYFMKVFSDELVRIGKPQNASDRLDYCIVRTKAEEEGKKDEKLGLKMRLIEMFEESWNINNTEESEEAKATSASIDPSLIFDDPKDPLKLIDESTAVYPPERLDYVYYLEHILQSALDQLYEIGYGAVLSKIADQGYTPQYSRKRATSVINPIKLINAIFEDYMKAGYTMEQIKGMMPNIKQFFHNIFASI